MQIFNEFCTTQLLTFYLGFANPNIIGTTRENMGYFCITIILLTMAQNFLTCLVCLLIRDIPLCTKRLINLLSVQSPAVPVKVKPEVKLPELDVIDEESESPEEESEEVEVVEEEVFKQIEEE